MKGTFFLKIGLVFILASVITYTLKNGEQFMKAFNNDYLLSRIVIDHINDDYEDFTNGVAKYKDDMSTFYGSLDFYYDNFNKKNRVMVANLRVVENDIKNLEGPSLKLYENCRYGVSDEDTSNMCSIYKENLKGVIESYDKLVVDYNEVLNSYNEFVTSYGIVGFEQVSEYESHMSDKIIKIFNEINK